MRRLYIRPLPGFCLDKRWIDDLALSGATAHVDRNSLPVGDVVIGVEQRERDADFQTRREGSRCRHPDGSVAVEHRQVGPQHSPADRAEGRATAASGPPPSRRAARRDPRTRPCSSRWPSRTAPATARYPATARGRAVDSPSRCAACRGRPRPASSPPAPDGVDERVEHHRRPDPRRQQFVAVLAGVAGAAHPHLDAAEVGVGIAHVVHIGRQPEPADDLRRFGSLHREDGVRPVLVGDGQPCRAQCSASAATTAAVLAALGTRKISSSET